MTKSITAKKVVSVITVFSIIICAFSVLSGISASAAAETVKLYSAETYFCKYGMTGTNVFVQTKDNASDQEVTVHYRYLGDEWRDSKADYVTTLGNGAKIWKAYIQSYNTQYAIKYVADGKTVWDNNNGRDYTNERIGAAEVTVNRGGYGYMRHYTVNATLQNIAYEKDVKVRYTDDNWKTFHDVPMSYKSANADGTEQWTAVLEPNTDNAGDFHYCVSYTVNGSTFWANNFGKDYDVTYRVYP